MQDHGPWFHGLGRLPVTWTRDFCWWGLEPAETRSATVSWHKAGCYEVRSREINSETLERNLPKMLGICAIRNVIVTWWLAYVDMAGATEVGAGAWWLALQRSSQVDVAEPVLDSKTLDANRGSHRFWNDKQHSNNCSSSKGIFGNLWVSRFCSLQIWLQNVAWGCYWQYGTAFPSMAKRLEVPSWYSTARHLIAVDLLVSQHKASRNRKLLS